MMTSVLLSPGLLQSVFANHTQVLNSNTIHNIKFITVWTFNLLINLIFCWQVKLLILATVQLECNMIF